jgi:FtsZ-interacting cell division protein ZipA
VDTTTLIIIGVVVAVVVILLVAFFAYRSRSRQERAREEFGPEYERAAEERGSGRKAERELRERRERVASEIRPLPEESRQRYAEQWEQVERTFVDNPVGSLEMADRVVSDIMGERNFPREMYRDPEESARGVGAMYPEISEDYRAARRIREDVGRSPDAGDTESLRQAIRCYRSVYERLTREERLERER